MGEDRIHVVSAAIVKTDGPFSSVLLAQRAPDTSFPLMWCTAGGKVEPGERPLYALRRELREELGLELSAGVQPAKLYDANLDPPLVRRAIYIACYRIEWADIIVAPIAGDKTAGFGWFGAAELSWIQLAPADAAAREHLIKALETSVPGEKGK
jgi:8-oxo-dGTP diphosphatase